MDILCLWILLNAIYDWYALTSPVWSAPRGQADHVSFSRTLIYQCQAPMSVQNGTKMYMESMRK